MSHITTENKHANISPAQQRGLHRLVSAGARGQLTEDCSPSDASLETNDEATCVLGDFLLEHCSSFPNPETSLAGLLVLQKLLLGQNITTVKKMDRTASRPSLVSKCNTNNM
ncbi:hypothetical protein ILYODFUR_014444 [Ilyodon furcidens]|uniref:Uncharacterized protein n=1 Tax=Ilyodon furcidens TaxID=33524 RepID=A0ABV0T943_9TELE